MTKALTNVALVLPEGERGLNDAQQKRVDHLLRLVADATAPKHRRDLARDKLVEIERGRKLAVEDQALDIHLRLLVELEEGRDPSQPPARDSLGRVRILSRDGLECLLIVEKVTPLQFAAGMRYRDLYEATERKIRSNLNREIPNSDDKRRLEDVGQNLMARNRLEAKVIDASRDRLGRVNGRALTTLRLVAGQGRTVGSLAPKSNANQQLYWVAFCMALDVCADHWGMQ